MSSWVLQGLSVQTPSWSQSTTNTRDVSEETRTVQTLSQDIARIRRETEYIKNHGERPPSLNFDYRRQLDVV